MKLILSSCDFRNEKSKKTILNNLSKPVDQCKLLFIPNEKATYETIHSEKYFLRMQEFGFARDNISVFDYYNEQQFINLDLDVIYISGGNTFATLKRIKDCGFDKEIIRYVRSGVLYIGGSAGAHIATQSVAHIAAFDPIPDGMTDFKGLGLFDGIIFCHYTEERKAPYDKLKSEGKYKVFALRDEDSLVVASTNDDVIRHYDLMIDENNDPVRDPEPLRQSVCRGYKGVFVKMKTLEIIGDNHFEKWTKHRIAARGIVISEDKILLTYEKSTDIYNIPGGGAEANETLEECCAREITEETGKIVTVSKEFLVMNEYYEEWLFETHFYVCKVISEASIKLSPREKKVGMISKWVNINEALSIFSKHQDYATTDEEKRGIYLREYAALNELVSNGE